MYVCMTCGRKFSQNGSANRHYMTQHLDVPMAGCHVCGRYFKNVVSRNKHRALEHGITVKMMKASGQSSKVPKVKPESDEEEC